jgi:hypothetical protein
MSKDFTATIREGCPRQQDWLTVLGTNEVVLKSPVPYLASAPGIPEALFFEMDLTALSGDQRARLITHLAQRFHVTEQEVARDLDQVGCPILAADVTVTVYHPQKWF